jgi:hypothetical protein
LIRFDTVATLEERFTLVLSQINKRRDTRFTISLFSSICPFRFYPTPGLPKHQISLSGCWTEKTAGGSSRHAGFFRCPQYRCVIGGKDSVDVHFEAMYPKNINALIIMLGPERENEEKSKRGYRYGYRVDNANKDEEAIESGAYRPGYVNIRGHVVPGVYTIILSTFAMGASMSGPFRFICACSTNDFKIFEVSRVPFK